MNVCKIIQITSYGKNLRYNRKIFCSKEYMQLLKNITLLTQDGVWTIRNVRSYATPAGTPGSGAGRGGGGGGSVRESGGGLGQYGAAQEEGYFFNKQREQLEKIKQKMKKLEDKSPEVKRTEDK